MELKGGGGRTEESRQWDTVLPTALVFGTLDTVKAVAVPCELLCPRGHHRGCFTGHVWGELYSKNKSKAGPLLQQKLSRLLISCCRGRCFPSLPLLPTLVQAGSALLVYRADVEKGRCLLHGKVDLEPLTLGSSSHAGAHRAG